MRCSGNGRRVEETIQGRTKRTNPNFLVRISSGRVGGLPSEGVGAKKFGMSLTTREIKLFWRDIPGFCRDIPAVPEKFEKKKFVFNFCPPPPPVKTAHITEKSGFINCKRAPVYMRENGTICPFGFSHFFRIKHVKIGHFFFETWCFWSGEAFLARKSYKISILAKATFSTGSFWRMYFCPKDVGSPNPFEFHKNLSGSVCIIS